MINSPSESTKVYDITPSIHQQHGSGRQDGILSKVVNICNLPAELQQKIAWNLNSRDYSSLRESCKIMSQNLDSFESVRNKLKQGNCSGVIEKEMREIACDKSVRDLLSKDSGRDIRLAVSHCSICQGDGRYNETTIAKVAYLPNSSRPWEDKRIDDIIALCRRGIHVRFVSGGSKSFLPESYPGRLWESLITFRKSPDEVFPTDEIFCSFHTAFERTEGAEKLVIATLATELRDYWCKNTPQSMDKNDIIKSASQYPDLFIVGKKAKNLIMEGKL